MQTERLRGFDDFLSQEVAHPRGSIGQDNPWRKRGKRQAAIHIYLADAKQRDDGRREDDENRDVQHDAVTHVA